MKQTKKILSVQGGGIKDAALLAYLLNLSLYYDKKNIDFLDFFDVFSGVSSGAIISGALVCREKFLKNIANKSPMILLIVLKSLNYNNEKIMKTIEQIKKESLKSYSTITIKTLIHFYETETKNIFKRDLLQTIKSLNGLLFSKYNDNKLNVFKEYFDYNLGDVPKNRTIVIKAINVPKTNTALFTNFQPKKPSDFIFNDPNISLADAINYSSNAPTYFPYKKIIDGGSIINSAILEDIFIFNDYELKIFKLNSRTSSAKIPKYDGIIGWFLPYLQITANYENQIVNNLIKYRIGENFGKAEFDYNEANNGKKINLDDVSLIPELIKFGKNKDITSGVNFLNKIIIK